MEVDVGLREHENISICTIRPITVEILHRSRDTSACTFENILSKWVETG